MNMNRFNSLTILYAMHHMLYTVETLHSVILVWYLPYGQPLEQSIIDEA